jgi:hypothetical protein
MLGHGSGMSNFKGVSAIKVLSLEEGIRLLYGMAQLLMVNK